MAEKAAGEGAETGMESWYHLPAEEDSSGFVPMHRETSSPSDRTELHTVNEGALHPGKESERHSIQLEIQDSGFSPCLPLLTSASSQGQRFFDDTLYQHTEMDFAPLSGSLDMSEFPGQPSLQMSDAVALAGREVSVDNGSTVPKHSVSSSPGAAGEEGSAHDLSQHPLSDRGDSADISSHSITDAGPLEPLILAPTSPGKQRPSSRAELERAFDRGDGSFLDSGMPAPELLALLEKDIGVSGSSEMSSRSSSSRTVSSKESESADLPPNPPQQSMCRTSDLHVPNDTSIKAEGECFRDASEVLFFDTESLETRGEDTGEFNPSRLETSGVTVRPSSRQSSESARGELRKQLCSEVRRRHQEKEILKSNESRSKKSDASSVCAEISPESSHKEQSTGVADQSGVSRDDLSVSSRCSIERGHQDAGISPAEGFPAGDASFLGRLSQPISQSTPGTFGDSRKQLTERLLKIKAKLAGSEMSLNEEPSSRSSASNVAASGKPQSVESSHGYPDSSDSQRSSSPQRRRIQSLPSLNYIEKVGTWNTNQSFDALVLRGLTGVSPKKKAYNAVADSLNRMLSRQASGSPPKRGLAASFTGASSMTSLTVDEKEASGGSLLTRSQSYNSVVAVAPENVHSLEQPVEEGRGEKTYPKALPGLDPKLRGKPIDDSVRTVVDDIVEEQDGRQQERGDSAIRKHAERDTSVARPASPQNKAADPVCSAHAGANNITLGQFSDVSLDNDFLSSSHSSEPTNQVSVDSAAGHSLTGLEADNFGPVWSPTAKTPDQRELNIEERIPTYLRNLGIDQSPSAILTSLPSNRPIREPEFSPSELRTIKGSTATPTRSMRLSEGGSQSAANVSQSSIYSTTSTTSVSIPMGSEAGHESPLPTEVSPSSSSRSDRPVSQYDAPSYPGTGHSQLQPVQSEDAAFTLPANPQASEVPLLDAPPPSDEDHLLELNRVRQLIQQFESKESSPNQTRQSLEEGPASVTSLQRASEVKRAMDSTSDSFIGSKTLKEIRRLLAEADHVGLHDAPPLRDFDGPSPGIGLNESDPIRISVADPSSDLLKDTTWNDSLNSDGAYGMSLTTDLNWDHLLVGRDPTNRSIDLEEEPGGPVCLQRRFGRSEPEGSNDSADDIIVHDARRKSTRSIDSPRVSVREAGAAEDLLGGVAIAVGGLEKALAATGAGYPRGGKEVAESDDGSSSADSLATRVKSLLKSGIPHTQTVQSSDGDGERPRGSMKLKLAGEAPADTELSEEDRRRIEEIKRELLEGAKRERLAEHPRRGHEDEEEDGWRDGFRLQMTPSPILTHNAHFKAPPQMVPGTGSDGYNHRSSLSAFRNTTAASALSEESRPTRASQKPDTAVEYSALPVIPASPRGRGTDPRVYSLPSKPNEEVNKPISITFASRRRFSPLSTSVEYPEPFPRDTPPVRGRRPSAVAAGLEPGSADLGLGSDYGVRSHEAAPPLTAEGNEEADRLPPQPSILDERDGRASPPGRPTGTQSGDPKPAGLQPDIDLSGRDVSGPGGHRADSSRSHSYSTEELSGGLGVGGRPSSADIFTPVPARGSSPTRRALSCIRVTLSPKPDTHKKIELVLEGPLVEETRGSSDETSKGKRAAEVTGSEPARNERPQRGQGTGSSNSAYRLHSPAGAGETPERVGQAAHSYQGAPFTAKRRSPLSDAATQITTESAEKTTFSAEIFIDGHETGDVTDEPLPGRSLHRATDQPLLLPYRPPGSPELFYVPYLQGASRVSPTSTVESSHPGSIDAVSPNFPAEVLGSDHHTDAAVPRHSRGIYSTPAGSARREDSAQNKEPPPDVELPTKLRPSSTPTAAAPTPQGPDTHYGSFIESLRDQGLRARPGPRARPRSAREKPVSSYSEESEFFPLKPEPDYSRERPAGYETSGVSDPKAASGYEPLRLGRPEVRGHIADQPLKESRYDPAMLEVSGLGGTQKSFKSERGAGSRVSSSQTSDILKRLEGSESALSRSAASNQSLDDLWARFTDRRKNQLRSESSNDLEMSLVERLDRLARLVQGPRSMTPDSERAERLPKESKRDEYGRSAKNTEGRWRQTQLGKGGGDREDGGTSTQPARRTLQSGRFGDEFHDGSVEFNSGAESTVTETDTATQTDSEATSSCVSTIDTERLIRAFGPERVRPSAKLSHLYSAIDLQKRRSEASARKQSRQSGAKQSSQGEPSELQRRLKAPSSSSGSWEPSPALRSKRNGKLSKGIQTGDLEIVTSATKKNTRDVGTTFPSPRGERQGPTGGPPAPGHRDEAWSHRPWRSAGPVRQGVSWFVPAEDLKSHSENRSRPNTGPALAWYEPVATTKPWRQPLREKHLQEESAGGSGRLPNGWHHDTETENRSPRPFVKVTLQESLETQRPDFIFRSGERIKRLQLLAKERRLQIAFQSERQELFNQPARRGESKDRNAGKGTKVAQRDRTIPKREMVERSKRVYQQLPEVRKKKEEEKRRSEYESNRMKAQLFKKKVTNQVLGRKAPWN